jgi:hypothetical protein
LIILLFFLFSKSSSRGIFCGRCANQKKKKEREKGNRTVSNRRGKSKKQKDVKKRLRRDKGNVPNPNARESSSPQDWVGVERR